MRWLSLLLLTTIGLVFSSCDGNEPDDAAGVITLRMRNLDHGNDAIVFNSCYLRISSSNNFVLSKNVYENRYYPTICDAGKKKLSAVKSVPSSGWVNEISVSPGHTYIFRVERYQNDNSTGVFYYMKVYVVDWIESTSGGIIGAEVKYCEWNPEQ